MKPTTYFGYNVLISSVSKTTLLRDYIALTIIQFYLRCQGATRPRNQSNHNFSTTQIRQSACGRHTAHLIGGEQTAWNQ